MYCVSFERFERMTQFKRRTHCRETLTPVEIRPASPRERHEYLKCRWCSATVPRREVLPGGYCPICKR